MRESLRPRRPVGHLTNGGYQGHVGEAGTGGNRGDSENMAETEPINLLTMSGRAKTRKELKVNIQDREMRLRITNLTTKKTS